MVAAILIVGFSSGALAAFSALAFLQASVFVAILAYFVFGTLGTCLTLIAMVARPFAQEQTKKNGQTAGFARGTVAVPHR